MKNEFCVEIGLIGGLIATALGGWDVGLQTLVIFMCIDYITGILVAGVFHKSKKIETGALESRAGWKGLIRKDVTLLIVLVAVQLDKVIGSTFIRDAVIIGFIAKELISIVENAGLMGIPIPAVITNASMCCRRRLKQKNKSLERWLSVMVVSDFFAFWKVLLVSIVTQMHDMREKK